MPGHIPYGVRKMYKLENNVATGEIVKIELTEEEIQANKKTNEEFLARRLAKIAENEKIELAKLEAKKPILEKLGITEEEAKLLLS